MWEEDPAYQKAQARMVGLLVLLLFIGSASYCALNRDWEGMRLVLYAGFGLAVALALFSLAAWLVVKAVARFRAGPSKPRRP
jgi:hypothetical protein